MNRVIVFGSLNMDLAIESDRMPYQGETLPGRNFFTNPGGKGANQAVAVAKFGAPSYLVGAVGTDLFGDRIVSQLAGFGVQCEEVRRCDAIETGTAVVLRCGGDNRIILNPGANLHLKIKEVDEALDVLAKTGDVFLTQLECDLPTTFDAIRSARRRGMHVVVNVAPPREMPSDVWECIDLVCVNETECEATTGVMPADDASIEAGLDALLAKGARAAVVTLGGAGSAAREAGENMPVIRVPAVTVDVADTTAAGDTFIGVLCASHVSGIRLEEGMKLASAAAGITASRVGAQTAIPTASEVDEFLAS